jgi:hypothetical protein
MRLHAQGGGVPAPLLDRQTGGPTHEITLDTVVPPRGERAFGQGGEEGGDVAMQQGVDGGGGDLGEGQKDEGALVEARVRDEEARRGDDAVLVEQEVEVEGAGGGVLAGGAHAAMGGFDGKQGLEQGLVGERGLEGDGGVQVVGRGSDGGGLPHRRAGDDAAEVGEGRGAGA